MVELGSGEVNYAGRSIEDGARRVPFRLQCIPNPSACKVPIACAHFENNATLYRTEKHCRPQNGPKLGEKVTKQLGFPVACKVPVACADFENNATLYRTEKHFIWPRAVAYFPA